MKHTYIIIDKKTNKGVFEFFDCKLIDKVNLQKYKVKTALQYLQELNVAIIAGKPCTR